MTTRTEMFEILMDEDFTPTEDGTYESWYDHKNVRVIIAGTHPEDLDEITLHVFTADPAQLLIWSASFTPATPTTVVQGAITAAVQHERDELARARRINQDRGSVRTYEAGSLGRVTIPDNDEE